MWEAAHAGKPSKFVRLLVGKRTVWPRFEDCVRDLCVIVSVTDTGFSAEGWAGAVLRKLRSYGMVGERKEDETGVCELALQFMSSAYLLQLCQGFLRWGRMWLSRLVSS